MEAYHVQRLATDERTVASGETDGPHVLVEAQRGDEASALRDHGDPRQIPGVDRDDHRVEAVFGDDIGGQTFGVSGEDTDTVVSGGGEEADGAVGDVRVDVDGGDLSGRADQFGDQGGVVAARADKPTSSQNLEGEVARTQGTSRQLPLRTRGFAAGSRDRDGSSRDSQKLPVPRWSTPCRLSPSGRRSRTFGEGAPRDPGLCRRTRPARGPPPRTRPPAPTVGYRGPAPRTSRGPLPPHRSLDAMTRRTPSGRASRPLAQALVALGRIIPPPRPRRPA